MRILAVETSGTRGGIALAEDETILEEVSLAEGLRHGRDLVLTIKQACEKAGWDRRHIDLAAVSIGPGSFTGIRIGVTFAKVLAFDAATKVVAVPSFHALARSAPPEKARIVTVVDAKRGGLFASIFERREEAAGAGAISDLAEVFGPALIEPEELAKRITPPAYILGHGIVKGREALSGFEQAPLALWGIRPAVVARIGLEMARRGEYADPLKLEPLYIRPPEAEELWERRTRNR
jgi:tRNA threonylcarbamoyladenosine biosynthesis protein TsaB